MRFGGGTITSWTFFEVAVDKLFCFRIYPPVLTRERKVG